MNKYLMSGKKVIHTNGIAKWCIGNWSTDLEKWEQVTAFKDIFRFFEFQNYPLQYPSTSEISEAYFKIYFVDQNGIINLNSKESFKCPDKLDVKTLALGYAPYGGVWQGHIFINDYFFWNIKTNDETKKNLIPTLIHEVAHCFNLAHVSDEKSLMYYADTGKEQVWTLDNVKAISDLYKEDRLKSIPNDLSSNYFVNKILK